MQHFGRINNFLAELILFITKNGQRSMIYLPPDLCPPLVYDQHFSIHLYSSTHFTPKTKMGDELTKLGDER